MDSKLKYIHLPKIKGLLGGEIALAYPQITYARQGQRILLITDVLTAEDAQAHKLFQGRMGQTLANIFERAIDLENIVPAKVLTLTTRVVRQQSALSDAERGENFHKITRRICQVIKRWQPDVIVFLGYQKFLDIWRQRVKFTERSYNNKQLMMLRGRLLPAQIAQHNCQIILSFSPRAFASLDYKDAKSRVNLIGFVLYDLATAMRGHNLYTVPAVNKSNCQVIHTIPEFNKFYEQLLIAATPSLDTEGDNLNRVYGNKLFCLLASFDGEFAYLLPLFHPQTPFTSEELEYITDKLRHYFEHATSRYIIFQNAKFDLLMFFAELKIRFCNHRIYDLMAGEYFLDENRKFFSYEQLNGAYSLEFIGAQYGALGYEDSPIAKEDRGRMAEFSLDQIMAYGILDVVYPYHISNFQIAEARRRGPQYNMFLRTVCELGSDMVLTFADMERNGSKIDLPYLISLMAPNNPINLQLDKITTKLKQSPAAKKANQRIQRRIGVPKQAHGLFGNRFTDNWLLNLNKPSHQQALFFDVLKLQPLEYRKDGGGKTNKAFLEEYKTSVEEVALLADYRQHEKLRNTYVTGIFKQLTEHLDNSTDNRLRASYWFIYILTVRSASANPNLQNLPSHGLLAKIIKRLFIASQGKLLAKADYSAHEVRGWANISRDRRIMAAFIPGMLLRRKIRIIRGLNPQLDADLEDWLYYNTWDNVKDIDEKRQLIKKTRNQLELYNLLELLIELELRGDVHRMNYEFFFNVPAANVNKDQRQSVKAVVFGTIYDKQAPALANELYKADIQPIRRKYIADINAARIKDDNDKLQELLTDMQEELQPFYQKAQKLIDKLFTKFERGGRWIKRTQQKSGKNLYAVSIFGAVRHLWGYLHSEYSVHKVMDRRGPNCVDMKTECLTEHGWRFAKELNIGDKIYTKNIQTGQLELQPIKQLTIQKYKGRMWRLNGGIDALVTPNHRWLVDYGKRQYQRPEMVTSEYIAGNKSNNSIHLVADRPHAQKGGNWTNNEVRLIGWLLTDGYYVKGNHKPNSHKRFNSRRLAITQSIRGNPEKVQKIDRLFNKLQITFTRSGPDKDHKICWRFYGDLGDRIKAALPKKIITAEFLHSLSSHQLQILYDTMLLGNGSYNFNSDVYDHFGAGRRRKANAFSMLCVLLGVSHKVEYVQPRISKIHYASMPNIPQPKRKFWIVTLKQRKRAQAMFYNSWEKYNGKVWCPAVDNGTFVARRNGSVYITGNTLIQGPASNIGYTAARIMARLAWQAELNQIDLGYSHNNFVHDSLETEAEIAMLPLTLYFLEHSLLSQTHKRLRQTYGFNMMLGLEADLELGGAASRMQKWDFTEAALLRIVGEEIDWMKKELHYKFNKSNLLNCVKYNFRLINKYRIQELQAMGDSHAPSELMLLTPELAGKLPWQINSKVAIELALAGN